MKKTQDNKNLVGKWSGGEEGQKTEQGQDSDEASLKDSDSSVYLIRCDSLCQGVGRRR